MNLSTLLEPIRHRWKMASWIGGQTNLSLLRRRMHRELPRRTLHGFYRTWVLGHAIARLKMRDLPPSVPSPLTIKISPTQKCNLRCKGCFASNYTSPGKLSLDTMERVISQAGDIGVHTVGVIGGEPLLVPEVFDLFREFPRTGFYLVTNGTLLRDDTVAKLQELPNVVTVFSLEGFRDTTDDLRGAGVFDKVTESMKRLSDAGLIFGFSTTVHRGNVDEVVSGAYLDAMIENGACFGGFLPYVPVGLAPRYEVVCSRDEVAAYYQRLDTLVSDRPLAILKEGYGDGSFLNQGCRAASTMHITSEGRVEPCNGIEFATHDVHSSTLRDALLSSYFQDLRDLHPTDGRRCLVNTEPEGVLRVVEKHRPPETHEGALEHLRAYAALHAAGGTADLVA